MEHLEWNSALPSPLLWPSAWLTNSTSARTFSFNSIMAFVEGQIDAIKAQSLQIHYYQLTMSDLGDSFDDMLTNVP